MSNTREQNLQKFESLLSRVRDIGISKRVTPNSDDFELEQQVLALDEFIYEYENLPATLEDLDMLQEISRIPTNEEIGSIIPKIFDRIIKGEWDGTPDAVKRLLVRNYPDLSPKKTKITRQRAQAAAKPPKAQGCLLLLAFLPIPGFVGIALYITMHLA